MARQHELAAERPPYFPETQDIIDQLRQDPTTPFECIHGGEPATAIYEVYGGCVAFPDAETQALCTQHQITNGTFEGGDMRPIVDLSLNARWSEVREETPDFCIVRDPVTHQLVLTDFASHIAGQKPE